MAALDYSWRDVEAAIGLPTGYAEVGDIPAAEKLRLFSREIEPLDVPAIQRIAAGNPLAAGKKLVFQAPTGPDLVDRIAAALSARTEAPDARNVFLTAVLKDLNDKARS